MTRTLRPRRWAARWVLRLGTSLGCTLLGGTIWVQTAALHAQTPASRNIDRKVMGRLTAQVQPEEKLTPPPPQAGGVQLVPQRAPLMEQRDESFLVIRIKTTPPERGELFRLEPEEDLRQRVAQETKQAAPNYRGQLFPPLPPRPQNVPVNPRNLPPQTEVVEPYFVCHGRLYFDQRNYERYGWNFGILQPMLCAGIFYSDLVRLPYDLLLQPGRRFECSSGMCLPGDPVPLIYNPFIIK